MRGEERRGGLAEAGLLALHIAAGLRGAGRLVDMEMRESGISLGLGPIADAEAEQEKHAHRRKERPALARVAHHLAEGVGERGALAPAAGGELGDGIGDQPEGDAVGDAEGERDVGLTR